MSARTNKSWQMGGGVPVFEQDAGFLSAREVY